MASRLTSTVPRRKPQRLSGFDYASAGAYFITICTHHRRLSLGTIQKGMMRLSTAGDVVQLVWESLPGRFQNLRLDTSQVMPNHFHAILRIEEESRSKRIALGQIVGTFKSCVVSGYCEGVGKQGWQPFHRSFWQKGFYDRIIRNHREYRCIQEYIASNPVRWDLDRLNPERSGWDEFDRWMDGRPFSR